MPDLQRSILFFDGQCNLCNRLIDFVVRKDRHHKLYVASLQGKTARITLPETYVDDLDTIVLTINGKIYVRSTAVLKALAHLGFPWSLMQVLLIIPTPLRDRIYLWVAKNRYRLFGHRTTCRIPTAAEKQYFLP